MVEKLLELEEGEQESTPPRSLLIPLGHPIPRVAPRKTFWQLKKLSQVGARGRLSTGSEIHVEPVPLLWGYSGSLGTFFFFLNLLAYSGFTMLC